MSIQHRIAVAMMSCALAACVVQQPPQGQAPQGQYSAEASAGQVYINGVALDAGVAQQAQIPAGRYWYDRLSGLWGFEGGPAMGVTQAGLAVGAEVPHDASAGSSGVSVNGRHLQVDEVAWLANFLGTPIQPGQYWLDHQGNMGQAGGPALVNLMQVGRVRGGDNFWSNGRTGSVGNESDGAGYVCTGGTCSTYGM